MIRLLSPSRHYIHDMHADVSLKSCDLKFARLRNESPNVFEVQKFCNLTPILAILLWWTTTDCLGQSVFYGFEKIPWFDSNSQPSHTPYTNQPPDDGPSTFRADFTAPQPGQFGISTGGPIGPSFSGGTLIGFSPQNPGRVLSISLNTPVYSVDCDFILLAAGRLEFRSSDGTIFANSELIKTIGLGYAGHLSFHNVQGFDHFELYGFDNTGAPTSLAIDNLRMATVPEPAPSVLIIVPMSLWVASSLSRRWHGFASRRRLSANHEFSPVFNFETPPTPSADRTLPRQHRPTTEIDTLPNRCRRVALAAGFSINRAGDLLRKANSRPAIRSTSPAAVSISRR